MTTATRPVPAAVRGARVPRADVVHATAEALPLNVLGPAFGDAAQRALDAGLRVSLWTKWSRPAWITRGVVLALGDERAYVRCHQDGIAASVIRRKALALFEVQP